MDVQVSFWLDNKMSTGIGVAVIGNQTLVLYRDRYYVVEGGAALGRGGKSGRFSRSSLPAAWRRAIRAGMPSEVPVERAAEPVVEATVDRKPVVQRAEAPRKEAVMESMKAGKKTPVDDAGEARKARSAAKQSKADLHQEAAPADCPYCGLRHNLPLDKRKNGKAFLVQCSRCGGEFAVRMVQVTMFTAQVAGFQQK